jgi:hypothetical protein
MFFASMTRQPAAKPITARARLPLPTAGSGLGPTSWVVLGIVCCTAFVAYSLGWSEAPLSNPDTSSYLQVAQDFSASGHFVQLHDRTPGLPLFLLLTGTGRGYFYTVLFLHLVSMVALVLLLSRFAVRMELIWAFVLFALLPPYMQNDAYLSSEALAGTLLVLGFVGVSLFILNRNYWIYCLLASVCFLCAGLTRPTNLITPFLLAGILALSRRKLIRGAALLAFLPALVAGAYVLYTDTNVHLFGLSAQTGYQLSNSTVRLYEYIDNPIAREEFLRARTELYVEGSAPNYAVWRVRPILKQRLGLSDVELGRFLLRMNLRLILHHPEGYLETIARGANMYWFPYETKIIVQPSVLRPAWLGVQLLVSAVFLLEITVLGGLAVGSRIINRKLIYLGDRALPHLLALAIIFQTMIVSFLVIGSGSPRYRSVTDPLILFDIALVADWGLTTWYASRREPLIDAEDPHGGIARA